jgi:hypothetical protein
MGTISNALTNSSNAFRSFPSCTPAYSSAIVIEEINLRAFVLVSHLSTKVTCSRAIASGSTSHNYLYSLLGIETILSPGR